MKETIAHYFRRYAPFEAEEIDLLYSHLKPKSFQRKSYLLERGKICQHQFFILEGLVRSFYIDDKGNEQIVQFGIEHWWVTNMESYIKSIPSELDIQALEDCQVLTLTKEAQEMLYEKIPKLERAFRKITENMLISFQRRNAFYLKMSGEEKYQIIVDNLPSLLQRVPQYMIASYLGMTPEHLSAIRKSK